MPDLANLRIRVGVDGKQQVKADLREVKDDIRNAATASSDLRTSIGMAGMPLIGLVYGARALESGLSAAAGAASSLTGVGIAANFQRMGVGLTGLLGNATDAKNVLSELREQGLRNNFDPEPLVGYSRLLLATGSNAKSVTAELQAMEDVTAGLGLTKPDLGRLSMNMGQIRQSAHPEERDVKELLRMGINLDRVVGAAQGKTLAAGEGKAALKGMSGAEAYDTLIRGVEGAFGGAAQRQAGTFLGIVQRIGSTLETSLLPTGALLLPVLTSVADVTLSAVNGLRKLNDVTGGGAGLVGISILLARSSGLLLGSYRFAITEVQSLTDRIRALGVASGSASRSVSVPGAAANGMYWNPGGGGMMAGAGAAIGTFMKGIGPWMIGDVAAQVAAQKAGPRSTAGIFLENVGTYGAIGATVGSMVPVLGTAVGGLIGVAVGEVKSFYDRAHRDDAAKTTNPQSQIAENTKRAADALESIKGTVIGGGARSKMIISDLEVEYALHRAIA